MIISHKHKFIFICPRKVASTSVRITLSHSCGDDDVIIAPDTFRPGLDTDAYDVMPTKNEGDFRNAAAATWSKGRLSPHFLPDTVREIVGAKIWDEYFKFTIIRNPWDLVVSYIHFRFGPEWPNRPGWNLLRRRGLSNARRRFRQGRAQRDFQRGHRSKNVERILKQNLLPYIGQIPTFYFLGGQAYADYYIRFENVQHDYNEICRLLKIPPRALPRTKSELRRKDDDYRDYYTDWSMEYVAELSREMISAFGYRFD